MQKDFLEIILVIVQTLTLLALIIYVIKTGEIASATKLATQTSQNMLKELRDARDEETRPYINIYFELVRNNILQLVIRNEGRTGAIKINFSFNPQIECTDGDKLRKIISENFCDFPLHPGGEIKTFFDGIDRYFSSGQYPTSYKVSVSNRSAMTDKNYCEEKSLNLSIYEGLLVLDDKGVPAIVDRLDKIAKAVTELITATNKLK